MPRIANLYIDAQHGLCNRLRAIASAAVVAAATGRRLIVIWCPDHHCQAQLADLFDYAGPVVTERRAADLFRASAPLQYNYMEIEPGSRFAQPILDEDPGGDVYVRSAYSLTSPHADPPRERAMLQALRPSRSVLDLVHSCARPAAVSVHIRRSTGAGYDHLLHESPENWPAARHKELQEWRLKSSVERFEARLDQLLADGRAESIFVAADLPETYARLADRYGRRLRWLSRPVHDRSAEQLRFALADLMLLTSAPLFLASTYSSFSDMAARLGSRRRRVERSGIDF